MPNEDSEKSVVTYEEYDKFRFKMVNEIRDVREAALKQELSLMKKLNDQSISMTRFEGILSSFTESVKAIHLSMEKMNDKVDTINEGVKKNDDRVQLIEDQLKEVVIKKKEHTIDELDDEELVNSNKAKWWSGFFVFLGIAIPAIVEKVDVIFDFILKMKG